MPTKQEISSILEEIGARANYRGRFDENGLLLWLEWSTEQTIIDDPDTFFSGVFEPYVPFRDSDPFEWTIYVGEPMMVPVPTFLEARYHHHPDNLEDIFKQITDRYRLPDSYSVDEDKIPQIILERDALEKQLRRIGDALRGPLEKAKSVLKVWVAEMEHATLSLGLDTSIEEPDPTSVHPVLDEFQERLLRAIADYKNISPQAGAKAIREAAGALWCSIKSGSEHEIDPSSYFGRFPSRFTDPSTRFRLTALGWGCRAGLENYRNQINRILAPANVINPQLIVHEYVLHVALTNREIVCLLYTSDAADE